ncbi:Potassium channel subfamily K member 1, partial [Schistosoma japonicum]
KTKNNLRKLFHPVVNWIQQMIQTLVYETNSNSSPVIIDTNIDNNKYTNYSNLFYQNIHQIPEYNLLHNNRTSMIPSNTIENFIDHNNITNNNSIDISSCRTTALIELNNFNEITSLKNSPNSKQFFHEHLTKQNCTLNHTKNYKQYNTLPIVTNSYNHTLSNTFNPNAYMFTSPTSLPTVTPLSITNQPKLYNSYNDSTKYFTYDGQHRKFYLMARYLRSTQRQRRHKRRVQKYLQQQTRLEMQRIENEKLYGILFDHQSKQGFDDRRRQNVHKVNSLHTISDDNVSNSSSVLGETGAEDCISRRIRLLCWKDIDIDLEVRSIDENYDDMNSLKDIEITSDWNATTTVDGATVIVNTNATEPRTLKNRKCYVKSSLSGMKCDHSHCKTLNTTSHANLKEAIRSNQSQVHAMTLSKNETLNHCTAVNNSTILDSDSHSPVKKTVLSFKPFQKLLTHPISEVSEANQRDIETSFKSTRPHPASIHTSHHQISMNKFTASKSGLSCLPTNNPLQYKQTTFIPTTSVDKTNMSFTVNRNSGYFQTHTLPNLLPTTGYYSQPNQYSTTSFLPESHSLQPDTFQRLLQSTVITNPFAAHENVSYETKPEQMGRSRLSLASLRGDLDSEVVVQLSYYSQRGSRQSEEDLSFFSYRDGFSTEEDVSKVTVPISLSLLIMTTYILIGAIVFSIWQDPDYLKWSYFCFITLSTIGFGDIVPGTKIDSTNPKEKMIIIVYMLQLVYQYLQCVLN